MCYLVWESHTDMSALSGLFSGGGVPFRPVANDGTLASPAMFCPMPLDCRRRRRMLSLCFVFLLGAPLSSGNGSDMAKLLLQVLYGEGGRNEELKGLGASRSVVNNRNRRLEK